MNNGCVCCTVRGDLIRVLHGLMKRQASATRGFDAIIIETTGLADPGPVAQTFFVDEEVKGKARLRRLNPLAVIHRAVRSQVALDAVLGRGGFDLERIVALEPQFLNPPHGEEGHVHDADCDHDHHDHAHHDHGHAERLQADDIRGVSVRLERPVDGTRMTRWLNELLADQGPDILRAKGIVNVAGEPRRLVFQAVHMMLEGDLQRPWRDDEARESRMVFIGRNLDEAKLRAGFEACAA